MVSPGVSTIPPKSSFSSQLHVDVFGKEDGPPILMLHGWGSSAELMRPAAAGLETTFRIHNVDLPGHGKSPQPPDEWGAPEYAEIIDTYAKQNNLSDIPVIAHSNGGRISLYMASDDRYNDLFSRLLLIAPSGIKPKRSLSWYLKTAWIRLIKFPFTILPQRFREHGLNWLRTTIYWRLAASTDYQNTSGVMRGTFVKTVTHHLDNQVGKIEKPTLIIWGDKDDQISKDQMERLHAAISNSELSIFPGAGHYAYLDAPADYQATASSFLTAADS